jgi:hypothetical protein
MQSNDPDTAQCRHCGEPESEHGGRGMHDETSCRQLYFSAEPSFMEKLDIVRQAGWILRDLEESISDLECALSAIHTDDFDCAHILLRAYQRRQGLDGAHPEEGERSP